MPHLPFTARAGLLALAVALAAGCASTPSQHTRQAQEQPMVQLQDPDQTPREKWSDAMVILRDGMGIQGGVDIQAMSKGPVSALPAGGFALGAAGYAAPPSGFSAAGALGAGLALGFLTAPPPSGPAAFDQMAVWVPTSRASSMEEAIDVALSEFGAAHARALAKPSTTVLRPTKYPSGFSPSDKYSSLWNRFLRVPVTPSSPASPGPDFLPEGSYYGPIFFEGFGLKMAVDRHQNKIDNNKIMTEVSKHLPEWFVFYNSGRHQPVRGEPGLPPSIIQSGNEMFFVSK